MNKNILFFLLAFLAIFTACEKEAIESVELDYGYEFFPLAIGHTWTYEADSIIYNPVPGGIDVDTIPFFIRETIMDTLRDNEGDLIYRILYSEKKGEDSWTIRNTYTAKSEKTRAIRNERNLTYIKLVFPITVGKQWDGNAFIDPQTIIKVADEPLRMFKDWTGYSVLQRLEDFSLEGDLFEEVIEVELSDSDNGFELRKGKEYYARGIGLIYQELMILDTQCRICCSDQVACLSLDWTTRAERGFILRKKLMSFQ